MHYLIEGETGYHNPGIADCIPDGQELFYINQASHIADAACKRSEYGLEIRELFNCQVEATQDITALLPHDPFIDWLVDEFPFYRFGDLGSPFISLAAEDFSIDRESGKIRNLSFSSHPAYDGNFRGIGEGFESPRENIMRPYHVRTADEIVDNTYPYVIEISFRAGYFAEKLVVGGVGPAADTVTLSDVDGLRLGAEFYFETDFVVEPQIDKRYIMAINTEASTVRFRPRTISNIAEGKRFRMIDKAVRAATAEIIADLLTYPPHTRSYGTSFGKGDIGRHWIRMNDQAVPPLVAAKLADYVKV